MSVLSSGIHPKEFFDNVWSDIMGKGHWHGEIWNRRKSGETYPQQLTICAVKDDDGTMRNFVGMFTDISERKEYERQTLYFATHDALTGINNRHAFGLFFAQSLERAKRNGKPVGFLFVDLDRFKPVNDKFGHHVGDRLLQEMASRIKSLLRGSDVIARIGGDEFAIILEDISDRQFLETMVTRIEEAVAKPCEYHNSGPFSISASVGISLYPDDGDDYFSLMHCCDKDMYARKAAKLGSQIMY
jgi:diguanylate cyclase (GGDEF)-like protein